MTVFMRNSQTGTIISGVDDTSQEYEHLVDLRDAHNNPIWEVASESQAEAAGQITSEAGYRGLSKVVAAVATAGADLSTVMGTPDANGHVTKVEYFPLAGQNGANTNSRTLTVTKTTGAITFATLALTSGVNLTANQPSAYTLSGTSTDLDILTTDTLTAVSTHVGTGITDPGGLVLVTYRLT
jgi:hypothetical protein